MLTHLHIKNFVIVEAVNLSFQRGLTIISGETGAGKSIIFDALSLVLGERADSKVIRQGCSQCEITAVFDISHITQAQQWLQTHELASESECIIRRIIQNNGRSQIFINDQPCSIKSVRQLAAFLIDIHGQHENHQLLQSERQRELLDAYGGHSSQLQQLKQIHLQWQTKQTELTKLLNQSDQQARQELLNYQIQELEALNLVPNEVLSLEQELKRLHHASTLQQNCSQALTLLNGDESNHTILSQLAQVQKLLTPIQMVDAKLTTANELLEQAVIQCQETADELANYYEHIEINPQRLQEIEERLNTLYQLARKHKISAEQLSEHLTQLNAEYMQLTASEETISHLQTELKHLTQHYSTLASDLRANRTRVAKKLSKAVNENLSSLGMKTSCLVIELIAHSAEKISPFGSEKIEFLISSHPSQPARRLSEVASGGELSRISLAIQVAAVSQYATPTLLLDEIDVGIGGTTAAIVGQLLRRMATSTQVFCITHLPQVAAHGHHHLCVQKESQSDSELRTTLLELNNENKIAEIARMLGGIKITSQAIEHAKELLAQADSAVATES